MLVASRISHPPVPSRGERSNSTPEATRESHPLRCAAASAAPATTWGEGVRVVERDDRIKSPHQPAGKQYGVTTTRAWKRLYYLRGRQILFAWCAREAVPYSNSPGSEIRSNGTQNERCEMKGERGRCRERTLPRFHSSARRRSTLTPRLSISSCALNPLSWPAHGECIKRLPSVANRNDLRRHCLRPTFAEDASPCRVPGSRSVRPRCRAAQPSDHSLRVLLHRPRCQRSCWSDVGFQAGFRRRIGVRWGDTFVLGSSLRKGTRRKSRGNQALH